MRIIGSILPGARRRKLFGKLVESMRQYREKGELKVSDAVKMRDLERRAGGSLLDYVALGGIWIDLEKKEAEARLDFVTKTIGEAGLRELSLHELAQLIHHPEMSAIYWGYLP